MFQLIVAVISIALVAALAIASIFYGGDAFTQSSEKANVTTLVNQGQQIAGAAQLYKTDAAVYPTTVKNLVDGGYLSVAPSPSKIASGDWRILTVAGSAGVATKRFAVVDFLDTATADALCVDGGEVEKQNGQCVTDAGKKVFGFSL